MPREEIRVFFRKAQRASGEFSIIHHAPASDLRVAVVVPKKIARKAVQRHRYKRIITDEIEKQTSHWESGAGIVVRMQKKPETESVLREDLVKIIHTLPYEK